MWSIRQLMMQRNKGGELLFHETSQVEKNLRGLNINDIKLTTQQF